MGIVKENRPSPGRLSLIPKSDRRNRDRTGSTGLTMKGTMCHDKHLVARNLEAIILLKATRCRIMPPPATAQSKQIVSHGMETRMDNLVVH